MVVPRLYGNGRAARNSKHTGIRWWWPESESNQRHADFQSASPRKGRIESIGCERTSWVRQARNMRQILISTMRFVCLIGIRRSPRSVRPGLSIGEEAVSRPPRLGRVVARSFSGNGRVYVRTISFNVGGTTPTRVSRVRPVRHREGRIPAPNWRSTDQ